MSRIFQQKLTHEPYLWNFESHPNLKVILQLTMSKIPRITNFKLLKKESDLVEIELNEAKKSSATQFQLSLKISLENQ